MLNTTSFVNWQHSLNRGLTAWWKVLPSSYGQRGNTAVDLVKGYKASLVGGLGYASAKERIGGYGTLNLDAVNDTFQTNKRIGSLCPTDGTISFEARHNNPFNNGVAEGLFEAVDSFLGLMLLKYTDGNIYAGWQTSGGGDDRIIVAASASNWPQRVWTRYTLTWVNTGITTLYVNDKSIGTKTATSISNPTSTVIFGYYSFLTRFYSGMLDDMRFVNRAYTAREVQQLYQESRSWRNRLLNWDLYNGYISVQEEPPITITGVPYVIRARRRAGR